MSTRTVRADIETPTGSDLAKRGAVALVVAVAVNALLVLVTDLAAVAPNLAHLSYGPVAVFTALGVLGAVGLYAALTRLVDDVDRTFTRVAVAALVLSMVPTALVIPAEPGATILGAVALGVMHVPPAVAAIVLLTRRGPAA